MLRKALLASAIALPLAVTPAAAQSIVEIAAGNDDFSTLVSLVEAAQLVEVLSGEGPFTVFAPTNAAFAALPEDTLTTLLMPENQETLQAILTYHVLPGAVMSGDVAGATVEVETVNGATVMVDGTDGVTINDANVVAADIEADNGVIHVIDAVILPPM